jgi:hypothetical protein
MSVPPGNTDLKKVTRWLDPVLLEKAQALEQLTLERDQLFLERKQRNREQKQEIRVPTSEEVRERLTHLTQLLEAGSSSGDELEQAAAKEIVRAVTGGMIRVEQRGERRMHAGWLVGKFRPNPMGLLRKEFRQTPPRKWAPCRWQS